MTDLPLMPKATAVWLVDNTTLTFRQIADFCGMHELEVAGIADGEVAQGIKGFDPIANGQVTAEQVKRAEADPVLRLTLLKRDLAPAPKRKTPRYTPVSKRQDRPAAIAWLVRYHPELEDSAISKLVGTTKPTIQAIRTKAHWNSQNIQPVDPVALGLCKQLELDEAVRKAAEKKAKSAQPVPSIEDRLGLMATADSLASRPEASDFSLDDPRGAAPMDADTLFNLPRGGAHDDDDDHED